MKAYFLNVILLFGFAPIEINAQNLVPDPGFEIWDGTVGSPPNTMSPLNFWYNANGTADHHHVNNPAGSNLTSLENCPLFLGQTQCGEPFAGEGVLGCWKGNGLVGSKEWAGTELTEALQIDRCYEISYWVQNKEDHPNFFMATSNWGLFFSQTELPSFSVNASNFNGLPEQWIGCTEMLDHNSEWVYFNYELKAKFNYPYIFVGFMGNITDATQVNWSNDGSIGYYVWFDEISVLDITPELELHPDTTLCLGDSIYLDFNSNYPVLWSDGQNSFSSSGFWIYPEENTTYTVQTVDTTQCTKYDTFTIQVRGSELANIQVDNLTGCAPLEVQFADTSMDPGINYFWDFGDGNVSMDFANTIHVYETPGNYMLSLGVEYGPDCGVYWMSEFDILVEESPEADFEYEIQELSGSLFELNFQNTSTGPALKYFWDFGDGTTSIEMNPSHLYSNPGNYIISLTVTTENGCEDEISYEINLRKDLRVYIPNIFSPNRDGINDAFTINFNTPVDEYACYIYDRWGSLIFESQDQYESWDGKFNGREVLPGVYSYFVQYSLTDSNTSQTQKVKNPDQLP